ncbi:S-layer homology domain-containing protein [Paenibacillus tyrfis]|uniref:S-layer homology domain-containing protein n=1 Tax=Paenibacillus tyrfis TaxID=1501230 RepID=UPI0015C5E899|nr:S-layer homology domain-containing protein [Paenibacillus tyrfis]
MVSAWLQKKLMPLRIVMTYALIAALLALVWDAPARASGSGLSGSSFNQFSVTAEDTVYYSGYWLGSGNYTKETPVYHFAFSPAEELLAGDTIQVQLPYQYNFLGNSGFFWSPNVTVPAASVKSTVGGAADSLFDTVTTQLSPDWHPALAFRLSKNVPVGANVDIRLANFLITPDYHHRSPGIEEFAVTASSNTAPLTAQHSIYMRSVANYYPDADTYATATATGYHFKFTVMQKIDPADNARITIAFPQGMSLPASISASSVKINGTAASSAVVNGNQLILQPSVALPSYSGAAIDIDASAQIKNPASPGYYDFTLSTSVDPLPATRRIGIISSSGASLADNPSRDKGYISIEPTGNLRFMFTSPTILKAGDTVIVTSPPGTLLTDPSVSPGDIRLEWPSEGLELDGTAASITRLADNQLQFILPSNYYLEPDYHLVFQLPNRFDQKYGTYDMQVTTSRTTKPATVPLLIAPPTVQNFTVTAGVKWAGASQVPYTFHFQTNVPLSADDGNTVTIVFPPQIAVPSGISPSSVTVNGLPAQSVSYSDFTHTLMVGIPKDIPLLGDVTVAISGNAGLTNPVPGTYSFSVFPNWDDYMKAQASIEYGTEPVVTGISAAPKEVRLKLGGTVVQQLQATVRLSDGTAKDVTAAAYGTLYGSSDANVAVVTADGLVQAKREGQAIVTVTNGSYSDTVQVAVEKADVPPPIVKVTGISAAPKEVRLKLGGTIVQQLQTTARLSDGTAKDVTAATYGTLYSSSDATVAIVTADGLIQAKREGQAAVTVTNGSYSETVKVAVEKADVPLPSVSVTDISAAPKAVELKLGGTVNRQLQVTARLSDGTAKDVTTAAYGTSYSSSNTNTVIVTADGLIQAKQEGQAIIAVAYGGYTAAVNVTVRAADSESSSDTNYGSSGGGTGPAPAPSTASTVPQKPQSVEREIMASRGGTVELNGVASVTIPAGALPKDGTVKVAVVKAGESPSTAGRESLGSIVEFASTTGPFVGQPLKLTLTYDASKVGAGSKPAVYYYNETFARWIYLGGSVTGNGQITAESKRFAKIAVFPIRLTSFSDMTGHWAAIYVDRLLGMGVVHGFEDGTFRPDQTVTRAQLVKMIADALALKTSGTPTRFADRDSVPDWAKDAIADAVQAGIIQGYEEKGAPWFKPEQPFTRAELVVVLARILEQNSANRTKEIAGFNDQKDIPDWAQQAVQATFAKKIISGYPDGSFRPGNHVTRAEAAKMIYMLLDSLSM